LQCTFSEKRKELAVKVHRQDIDNIPSSHARPSSNEDRGFQNNMSAEDYIAQLEAELYRMRGGVGNASSS